MSADTLRKSFLDFFAARGHRIVPSSSLIPDDPSVLFTTAGMQQFKPYYTGELDPKTAIHSGVGASLASRRVATVQPCIRTSDIEEVGDDTHLTFFEMLGNFSFGALGPDPELAEGLRPYFKKEAIAWGHEFVKDVLKLPIAYVTVFGGDNEIPEDKESYEFWRKLGLEDIRRRGREDNFWGPTGSEGPCGPTTEIYARGIEVWNIVFNEYYCNKNKSFTKLNTPGVDTGMGLERALAALEQKKSVFETSVFAPLMAALESRSLHVQDRVVSLRVVADHLRAATFLIANGIRPSNLERGYIVRRLIRRAVRSATRAKLSEMWWQNGLGALREIFRDVYPEILDTAVEEGMGEEIEKFSKTLDRGLRKFDKITGGLAVGDTISSMVIFDLYQTDGFPPELTAELAAERGYTTDLTGLEGERKKHEEISRASQEKKFGGHGLLLDTGELKAATPEELAKVTRLHTATHLLQAALRAVLGSEVTQAGSDITVERLRFDFTFPRKVTPGELVEVEKLVNQKIQEDLPRTVREMPFQEALADGALAFFRGKYPPTVKVFSFGDPSQGSGQVFSKEVCGGPHVEGTHAVGKFKIIKEEASSAGIRRIRAIVE